MEIQDPNKDFLVTLRNNKELVENESQQDVNNSVFDFKIIGSTGSQSASLKWAMMKVKVLYVKALRVKIKRKLVVLLVTSYIQRKTNMKTNPISN